MSAYVKKAAETLEPVPGSMAARLLADPEVPAKVYTEKQFLASQTVMLSFMLIFLGAALGLIMGLAAIFTATNTMLRSTASTTWTLSIAKLCFSNKRSSTRNVARAAPSTRPLGVSAASSSAVSCRPPIDNVTDNATRIRRLPACTDRFSNNTPRCIARSRTAETTTKNPSATARAGSGCTISEGWARIRRSSVGGKAFIRRTRSATRAAL